MKPYYSDKYCTIYHGDCAEILPQLDPVDLVLTDPPYELSDSGPGKYHYGMSLKKFDSEQYKNIVSGVDYERTLGIAVSLQSVASVFCFCSNKQISNLMSWGEGKGYAATLLIWHKTNSVPFANGVWRGDIEYCVHIRGKGAYFKGDSRLKSKVFSHPIVVDNVHPTVKPIKLIARYIRIGSMPGGLVLDPFMGSGTTLRAAKDLGRKAIGIELEERYCEIAANRLRQEVLDFG